MDIRYFHKYRRMVRRGFAEPLTCEDCENEFALRVDDENEPVLECFTCEKVVKPGLRVYDEIKRVVKGHFGE